MFLLFVILLLAVRADVKTFRIPNRIILTGYGGGILYQVARQMFQPGQIYEVFKYMTAALVLLFLLIPLFKFRVIGGGDVKLFSVCGMYMGFQGGITIVLYSFLIGAVISVFSLAYRRFFSKVSKPDIIHFSIPILFGTVTYCLYGGWIWQVF